MQIFCGLNLATELTYLNYNKDIIVRVHNEIQLYLISLLNGFLDMFFSLTG